MFKTNELIINGKSTADFPFLIAVEELDPPQRAERKDKIFETDFSTGYLKQTINAYQGIVKTYKIYLHETSIEEFDKFKTFIADEGWFTPYNDPTRKYYFVKSEMKIEPMDKVNGYQVTVEFSCQPFAMEDEEVKQLGSQLVNHTNAPMFPLIKITGATGEETFLTIGDQKMTFKEIQDVIYIECKPLYQDAYSSGGRKVNNEVKGDFFVIEPGTHKVTKGQGISSVEITCRWGWR